MSEVLEESQDLDFETKCSQIIEYTQQIGNIPESNVEDAFAKIYEICEVMDDGFKDVKTSGNALMDISAFASTSQAAKVTWKYVNSKICTFNAMDFANKLLEMFQNDQGIVDLSRVHSDSDPIIRRTGFNPIVLNTFIPTMKEIEQKKSAVVNRREKDKVAEKKTVKKDVIAEKNQSDPPSVDVIAQQILKCLSQLYSQNMKQPISYFHFILDPTSYGQTVQNIFHTAFLIRDNNAKMGIGEDGLPTIAPHKEVRQGKENGGDGTKEKKSGTRSQMCVSLNLKQYKELVEVFGITSALIPSHHKVPNTTPLQTVHKRRPNLPLAEPLLKKQLHREF